MNQEERLHKKHKMIIFKKKEVMHFAVKCPCIQGYYIREFETKEGAEKCLNRLKEQPFIYDLDKLNQ